MHGATSRYAITAAVQPQPGEALAALAEAAERISTLRPADAECARLLARLSRQLAEATAAVEDAAPREIAIADVYAAGQAAQAAQAPARGSSPRSPALYPVR